MILGPIELCPDIDKLHRVKWQHIQNLVSSIPLGRGISYAQAGNILHLLLFLYLLKPLFPAKGAKTSPYNGWELMLCEAWRNLYHYLFCLTFFRVQVRSLHAVIPSFSLIVEHIF